MSAVENEVGKAYIAHVSVSEAKAFNPATDDPAKPETWASLPASAFDEKQHGQHEFYCPCCLECRSRFSREMEHGHTGAIVVAKRQPPLRGTAMTTDQKAYNANLIAEFRATRDQPEGPFPGRPLLLLTTIGAKSGLPRTTPLMYATIEGTLLLIGSNMGAAAQPDWCRNLIVNPQVSIEVGKERYSATARVATGDERARLWEALVAQFPFFVEHQAKTTRQLPLIVIEREE